MNSKNLFKILISLFCITSNMLSAQSNLDNGWSAFLKNNRKEAHDYFIKASAESASVAESYLALAFIEEVDGKNDAAFKNFQAFFKTSQNPYPYLFALWHTPIIFSYQPKLNDNQLDFLKSILVDPKANGTIKAMAHSTIGRHFQATNNVSKARAEFDKIGSIDEWQLAGEFENISESGFDKKFGPITNASQNVTFINKNGAQVKWFDIKGSREDKWIDFSYNFFIENSIIYAQTFINSPIDQQAQLRIGTSGSIKSWVNDALVYNDSKERNNDIDTYIAKVNLNKGNNRILLQIGSSDIESSNFLARITDNNGDPLEGIKASTTLQLYAKSQDSNIESVKIDAENFFENTIKAEPDKISNYLILAAAYLRNDKSFEARKVLLQAQDKAPECSYIKTKLIEAYNREDNETDAKIATEWLKDHDADNLISLNLFYNEEAKKENYEAAEKIINKMESTYGETEETLLKHLTLMSKLKNRDELINAIEKAYKKYPDYYDFVESKCSVEQEVNKDFDAAIDVIKKYLKNNFTYNAQMKLSNAYFVKGDVQSGLTAYAEQLKHEPLSCGTIYKMAEYYYKVRDYNNAVKYFRNAISIAPYVNYFWSGLAECFEAMGKKQDAIEAYEKSIEYKPTDYESRKSLRKLLDKPEVFSYFLQPDVYSIIKNAPAAETYPEDNSLILEEQVQKVVYAGGASEEKHIFVVKIFNQDGIDRWKEYWIQHNGMQSYLIEKAEVVKAKGSKVEAEINNSHIVFTALEVGDAIHITFRLKNYLTGKLAPHFWDNFYFTHWFPYVHSQYSLLIAPDVKFKYEFSQKKIEPIVKKADEFDLYTWDKTNQPSLRYEDKMPELADVANVLYISSFPDWKYISSWYYDLASTKAKSDFEVREVVNSLFSGAKNLTELQKAKIIYEYIVKNIAYSSVSFLQSGLIPQKASKVINTKIGDCKDVSTLFVAMCKEIGIKADWVLVNTRDKGNNKNILPSIEFNHCITRLYADGKEYYIELTSNTLPFNTCYNSLINAEVLPIVSDSAKETISLMHLSPLNRYKNNVLRNMIVTFNGDQITVKKVNSKTGVLAADLRDSYRDIGEQEQKKTMQKAINGEFPNIQLTSLNFTNLKSNSDTVQYEIVYKASDALIDIGGMQLFTIPWGDKTETKDFVFNESRNYPIDLWNWSANDSEQETVVINIPTTLHLSEIPKEINYTSPISDYSLSYKVEGNKLTATRHFVYKKRLITLDEVDNFRDFYKKVVLADSKPIALK